MTEAVNVGVLVVVVVADSAELASLQPRSSTRRFHDGHYSTSSPAVQCTRSLEESQCESDRRSGDKIGTSCQGFPFAGFVVLALW